ncbi:hypothetical protein C4H11_01475 [Bacteroides zoogleoformans]|uniref:Uncharacterized protein n=1 Tax=Bacteroides zoogleoformans TaxID=28119 RepID=A0ABM6T528_9BACE|nr:hypothetical protein C4H11_01475 [Bacteroides zoogleoformans]
MHEILKCHKMDTYKGLQDLFVWSDSLYLCYYSYLCRASEGDAKIVLQPSDKQSDYYYEFGKYGI